MPKVIRLYVHYVDKVNRFIGRCAMYLVFAMMGILLYSSFMKTFASPVLWSLEMAQFVMVTYYLIGGSYSMQEDGHVRMDLFYSQWTDKTKTIVDCVTILFLITYLGFLLYGGIYSTEYALKYGEESYSAWAPSMVPIKVIMVTGIFLMLLQAISCLFKDIAKLKGESLA
ncbi:TRAP transporter small permease subunit [Aestuariirhabdus sp. LZHN29]|uniref:TRAP transporter small permease subunit n=1 Tax=Aestuariirhabdus sp. LZHN29 TaxID=3417462 RepID=UPI003CF40883